MNNTQKAIYKFKNNHHIRFYGLNLIFCYFFLFVFHVAEMNKNKNIQ